MIGAGPVPSPAAMTAAIERYTPASRTNQQPPSCHPLSGEERVAYLATVHEVELRHVADDCVQRPHADVSVPRHGHVVDTARVISFFDMVK